MGFSPLKEQKEGKQQVEVWMLWLPRGRVMRPLHSGFAWLAEHPPGHTSSPLVSQGDAGLTPLALCLVSFAPQSRQLGICFHSGSSALGTEVKGLLPPAEAPTCCVLVTSQVAPTLGG